MLKVFLLTLVIVLCAVILLGVNILFKKNGRFPNTHIGASKAMRDRGIFCAQTQDRMARMKKEEKLENTKTED
ncbi:MAG: hypothetical protein M0P12_11890 [Paludibacteraceae bacterium]|mgnify:CR=1 FL=1|jgi:hypothetical protein|nr:hypothetical protein [Paludibacteraceae bacterium]HOI27871.1 hypothetical protein [Paludibacteraceae bacterium]HOU69002.1 hypothetical protein [Paludibacteraceae bacterium]HPH63861.1 hypothetical protein [Paludibacteraceae bacterium]HQF51161.1 hypothetical protein [Paludibacteraceae bacterium]